MRPEFPTTAPGCRCRIAGKRKRATCNQGVQGKHPKEEAFDLGHSNEPVKKGGRVVGSEDAGRLSL